MARIKHTPPPITSQRGAAYRIVRQSQARLAAAEALDRDNLHPKSFYLGSFQALVHCDIDTK